MVTEGYGKKRIAAIADDPDPSDAPECQDLLADVDLTTLDKATVAALYEELQQPDFPEDESDFSEGQ